MSGVPSSAKARYLHPSVSGSGILIYPEGEEKELHSCHWCVVVTGVNLVICEKGGDWFREMMGVKMGGICGVLSVLVV